MKFYVYDDSRDIFNSMSNEDRDANMYKNESDAGASSQNDVMATNGGKGRNVG